METINNPKKFGRREAMRVIGQGVIGCTALAAVVARSNEANAEEKKLDCSKEGKIEKASKQMRKALQYVDKSKKKGQVCSKCMQWNAPAKGKSCGGCKLFTGPVNPNGYCLSFAPSKA